MNNAINGDISFFLLPSPVYFSTFSFSPISSLLSLSICFSPHLLSLPFSRVMRSRSWRKTQKWWKTSLMRRRSSSSKPSAGDAVSSIGRSWVLETARSSQVRCTSSVCWHYGIGLSSFIHQSVWPSCVVSRICLPQISDVFLLCPKWWQHLVCTQPNETLLWLIPNHMSNRPCPCICNVGNTVTATDAWNFRLSLLTDWSKWWRHHFASRWHSMAVVWHIRLPSGPDLPHRRGERHDGELGCLWGGEEGSSGEKTEGNLFSDCLNLTSSVQCRKLHWTVFYAPPPLGYTILPWVSVLQYCTVS